MLPSWDTAPDGICVIDITACFGLLALCEENPPVTGGFLSQRASNFDKG